MAEFHEIQSQLPQGLASLEAESREIFVTGERLKKLDLEKKRVERSHGVGSEAFRALTGRQIQLERSLAARQERLTSVRAEMLELVGSFEQFSDPREHVAQLSDEFPILLFPVRLETRFKILTDPNGAQRHQLWVRVFPDECSVDTFDDVLSESEVSKVRNYWTAIWQAGRPANEEMESFVREKKVGAWQKLMGLFNAGRSYWISGQHRPVNEAEIPPRETAADRLLIIPTDDPPSPADQESLKVFWEAVLRAGGPDQEQRDQAFTELVAATGGDAEAARGLVATYVPQNLAEEPDEPAADPAVTVSFLVFDKDVDAKLTAWSQAAKVRTFPERFVLLGYQGNDAEPVISRLGASIPDPLIVGPDTRDDIEAVLVEEFGPEFADLSDEEKAAKYVEYLAGRSDTSWLFNFDRAVAIGMGFRVDLTPVQYQQGFTRLMVLGIKLGADSEAARGSLEQLLHNHQFGDSGFSLLAQGTPTNNTEDEASGHSETEQAEEAYDRYHGESTPDDPAAPNEKRDGRHLAEILGVDPTAAGLPTARNYYGRDQMEARAMHTALWNATIGYFLESMAPPLASERAREIVRSHLLDHVRGRGAVPAIRIGDQPYGILPVSDLPNLQWLSGGGERANVLAALYRALVAMRGDLEGVLAQVAHVGKGGGADAHQILLQALGLHAGSVEFDRRIAQSFQQIRNALYAQGHKSDSVDDLERDYKEKGLAALAKLGYQHDAEADPELPILNRSFLDKQEDVTKDLIDDNPLSEQRQIRAYTETGENYIEWLIDNARNNHSRIRRQEGFSERPSAILYDMLRHALNLEFGNASLKLHQLAEVLDVREVSQARMDADFIGIQADNQLLESKWDLIYRQDERIAPAGVMVADHISGLVKAALPEAATDQLQAVIAALEILKDAPTARLERCLVEHLDCCHYRLDAWLLSFLSLQLEALRSDGTADEPQSKRGIYLGAYGWVENLKPENKQLEPAPLDGEQRQLFDPDGAGDVVTDSKNAGYLHAPSIAHGLTAAVLRNAYTTTASDGDAERYQINLSSERVRMALAVIEGMQQGQGLAELLGYRLERGLHDNNEEELDIFIYELRKVFPLASNRLKLTAIAAGKVATTALETVRFQEEEAEFEDDKAVTKIEARNVVNGLALLDHIESLDEDERSYPFGFPTGTGAGKLREADDDETDAIDAEVQRLRNVRDAVADLAIAESVHQVVQGNFDRAAGSLDAYSKGSFPQLPDVIQSPASGLGLTHRLGIHLPAGVSPDAGQTPRSKAEPAVNAWLVDLFPPAATIACGLRFRIPADEGAPENAWSDFPVTLAALGLEPIDLLYLYEAGSEKNLSALDDQLLRLFRAEATHRPNFEFEINYTESAGGNHTFFELGALLAELRTVVVAARPLEASDIALQNEASKSQNIGSSVDSARIVRAKAMFDAALAGLKSAVLDDISPLVDLEDVEVGMGNLTQILNAFEAASDGFVQHMTSLSLFGGEGYGSGFLYDRERELSAALRAKVLAFAARWTDYHERYEVLVNTDLPAAVNEEAKIEILRTAEALISATSATGPGVASSAGLLIEVQAKIGLFDAKRLEIGAFLAADFATLRAQYDAADALILGMDAFDLQPLDITDQRRLLVVLAEDLSRQSEQTHAAGLEIATAVQSLLDGADTATAAEHLAAMKEAAALLFGEGFLLLPEFQPTAELALELQNCLDDQDQLLAHQKTALDSDFPVDDWLYGVARVREKAASWENLAILAEAFRERPPLDLTPFQLPYRPNDSWLALAYPEMHVVDGDSLLYTAYAPGLDPTQPQVGVLVDEWTETVPSPQETTALAFHYDRPNCEAPQSLLLVTPASMTGEWSWQEIVASMHEALELARLRAFEPDQLDQTGYARLLPATVATWTFHPVTMFLNYAVSGIAASAVDDG